MIDIIVENFITVERCYYFFESFIDDFYSLIDFFYEALCIYDVAFTLSH
ncbi:MAG: hypothetical protein ACI90V_013804, partial [Bacillariaceae sp.]